MMYDLQRKNFEAFTTVPNAFAPHEIDILRDLIQKKEKIAGVVSGGVTDKQVRDSRIQWLLPEDAQHHWAFDRITGIVSTVNSQHFGMDLTAAEGIQLTEYDAAYYGFYGAHTDSGYGQERARARKLSLTVQLSDSEEYEGGDLNLYWNDIKHPFTASRTKGTMTLFRSHILHEVMPVTSGKRLSMVTWVHGPLLR